jgi:hypothetical protein
VNLHLWFHCFYVSDNRIAFPLRPSIACPTDQTQASDYVTDSGIFEHHSSPALPDLLGGTDSASQLWKTSAQTIGEILVLSDIINPLAYAAQPLVNPAFYFASCCYIKGEWSLSWQLQSPYVADPHMSFQRSSKSQPGPCQLPQSQRRHLRTP